jgi:hypothetical protein
MARRLASANIDFCIVAKQTFVRVKVRAIDREHPLHRGDRRRVNPQPYGG